MDKIKTTLEQIRDALNDFLQNVNRREGGWVELSNLVNQEGQSYGHARNKVVMFLANIQNETTISTYRPTRATGGDDYVNVSPPLYINLYVLLYANFLDDFYTQGLALISRTISFFQRNPSFSHANLPGLDPSIDKLTFEMVSLDITDLNYLMALAGTKYLPSAYYKVRLIPFADEAMRAEVPPARGVDAPRSSAPVSHE